MELLIIGLVVLFILSSVVVSRIISEGIVGVDKEGVFPPEITISSVFLFLGTLLFVTIKASYWAGEVTGEQNQLKGTPKYKMEVRYALDEFDCPIPTDTVFVDIK